MITPPETSNKKRSDAIRVQDTELARSIEQSIDQEQLNQLAQMAQIREMPFRSQTPIIGPLIAQLRSLWASVAAREQARSFTMQQNKINQMLANDLREIETRFQAVEADLLDHDEKQVEIKQRQLKVQAELSLAYELLGSIKARLERIEEHPL